MNPWSEKTFNASKRAAGILLFKHHIEFQLLTCCHWHPDAVLQLKYISLVTAAQLESVLVVGNQQNEHLSNYSAINKLINSAMI